ncbi:TPA: hypothetical protein DDW35_12665 [Candidatus Sumerlaeota bacterium]|jgi:hypothetical protein|nr:hypothetical protein [Candidatus Sumerlaeota bacterium]
MCDSDWLPTLILFEDCCGDWPQYLSILYEQFKKDFVFSKPSFPLGRIELKKYPIVEDKEATFWHFISEGDIETQRIPDFRRCERIAWPKPIIEAFNTGKVVWWENTRQTKRGPQESLIIALENFNYWIVLRKRENYFIPWTAYYPSQDHQRRKMQKEYEVWLIKKSAGAALPKENGPDTPSTHGR